MVRSPRRKGGRDWLAILGKEKKKGVGSSGLVVEALSRKCEDEDEGTRAEILDDSVTRM